ncbi:Lipid A export ATP-binding/permease protein MsbA [Chitinispirillum alkaliphilum]|nr:Lipid A export ATP-binding/permease protein MsbA [Chitinispirillum alkaliphilum]
MKKKAQLYVRMWSYLWAHRLLIVVSMTLSLLVVTFEGLSLWFSASLVQTLFTPDFHEMARPEFTFSEINEVLKYYTYQLIYHEDPMHSLRIVCFIMASTFLLKNIFLYLKSLVMCRLNLSVVRDMQNQLYAHALKLPVTYYDRSKSGETSSLIVNDINKIKSSMTSTYDKLFIGPLRVLFFIFMLFVINVRLTLAIFIIFPVLGVVIWRIGKSVRRRSKRVLEHMSDLFSILHETVNGIRAVKMFNMHRVETDKFRKKNEKLLRQHFKSVMVSAISSPLTEVLGVTVVIILLWYGGSQVLAQDGFGAEDFVRFLIFLFSTFAPLKMLTHVNTILQSGFAAAERVFNVLDQPTEPLSVSSEQKKVDFEKEITFSNVSFKYPGTDESVLKNVNFTFPRGSIIAIVGASGSGKSTILDLLPRFYTVTDGSILLDGQNINDIDLSTLRDLFGIVSQDTILFNESIYYNITYGLQNASMEEVVNAAQAANAMEFIQKLPDGFDTNIGDHGVMLSGGQRQRISIARALLKNPSVLILDEATSSLDTESERLVQSAINNLIQHRSALVVAHRLSTIQNADKILVLENGKITEEGTHESLLKLGKRYKYLHDIQFSSSAVTN